MKQNYSELMADRASFTWMILCVVISRLCTRFAFADQASEQPARIVFNPAARPPRVKQTAAVEILCPEQQL